MIPPNLAAVAAFSTTAAMLASGVKGLFVYVNATSTVVVVVSHVLAFKCGLATAFRIYNALGYYGYYIIIILFINLR